MHKFLLALTLRPDTVLERVVRRLMSLQYFSSHGRLLALVTARGKHNETIMHNMCRVGHVTTLKLFLCLFSQNISGNAEISGRFFVCAWLRLSCTVGKKLQTQEPACLLLCLGFFCFCFFGEYLH